MVGRAAVVGLLAFAQPAAALAPGAMASLQRLHHGARALAASPATAAGSRRHCSVRGAAPVAAETEAAAAPAMVTMDELTSLCKRRGFIFQSSEVYGGFAGFYDYGPLGVELRNNIKKAWWKDFVHKREDVVGLDSSIIGSPKIWKASGHVDGFSDPMVDCKESKLRYRADQVPTHAILFVCKHTHTPRDAIVEASSCATLEVSFVLHLVLRGTSPHSASASLSTIAMHCQTNY